MADRVLGPSGGMRRRRSLGLLSLAGLLALALTLWFAIGAGAVSEESGFEDEDGNLAPQAPINFDWNSFKETTWSTDPAAPYRESDKVVSGWTFKGIEDAQKPANRNDTQFAGGTKQDHICPTVNTTGNVLNKDDLKRIYLSTKVISGHTYLNLAWARVGQNSITASAHVAFEFNKGETACGAPSDGLVERTTGDMLVVYDFEGGSADPTIKLARWYQSATDTVGGVPFSDIACDVPNNSPPCWGTAVALTAGQAEAEVNADGDKNTNNDVIDEIAPSPDETLGEAEFGEAGIDLTDAGVFTPGSCESFGKAFAVSRTSGNSGQAQMTDLVGPADFTLANCGDITIIKQTDPAGINQAFSYQSNIAGAELECSPDDTPASFTLNDGAEPPADTETCVNVPPNAPGTNYTVTEGADPTGFEFTDLSCTATGDGTSATPLSGDATRTATITMAAGGSVTCTYTNTQQLGAIEVTKTRKHAADGPGDHPHPGVGFRVRQGTTPAGGGVTDADGKVCIDGLEFGTYTVTELVPPGYSLDPPGNNQSVTVDNNAKCSDDPFVGETVSFHNTPLTDIDITATGQVPGGTNSRIECRDQSTNGHIGDSPDPDTGLADPAHVNADGLKPGLYTCRVVIDP